MWLNNIEQLRKVQWGNTAHWDISFPSAVFGEKSAQWFPATSVTEVQVEVEKADFSIGNFAFSIPKGSGKTPTLSVTFIDDADMTLSKWIRAWMKGMQPKNGLLGVRLGSRGSDGKPLVYRQVLIEKYKLVSGPVGSSAPAWAEENTSSGEKAIIEQNSYLVFPSGEISFKGTSTAGLPQYTVTFNIVGE